MVRILAIRVPEHPFFYKKEEQNRQFPAFFRQNPFENAEKLVIFACAGTEGTIRDERNETRRDDNRETRRML